MTNESSKRPDLKGVRCGDAAAGGTGGLRADRLSEIVPCGWEPAS